MRSEADDASTLVAARHEDKMRMGATTERGAGPPLDQVRLLALRAKELTLVALERRGTEARVHSQKAVPIVRKYTHCACENGPG